MGRMTSNTNPYNILILSRELTWLERYICFGLSFLFFFPELFPPACFLLYCVFVFFFFSSEHFKVFFFKLKETKGVSLKAFQHIVLPNEHMGHLLCDVSMVKDICMLKGKGLVCNAVCWICCINRTSVAVTFANTCIFLCDIDSVSAYLQLLWNYSLVLIRVSHYLLLFPADVIQ